jgi:hypothetical protein
VGLSSSASSQTRGLRTALTVSVARAAFEAGDNYARDYALLHLEELVRRQRAMFSIAQGAEDDGALAAEANHMNLAAFMQSHSSHRPIANG